MKSNYEIVKRLLRTEKGSLLAEKGNKYFFDVDTGANKLEIKRAVEKIYNVKVVKVNTLRVPGKPKTLRQASGYTSEWKKAIVTLKAGHKIEMAAS